MTITLVPPTEALEAETSALVTEAQAIKVHDAETYTAAAEWLKGVKSLQRKITDFFGPLKQQADRAHKGLCAAEASQLAPVAKAELAVKLAMLTWQRAEDVARTERQRQLEADQRRLEEERRRADVDRKIEEAARLESQGDSMGAERAARQAVTMETMTVTTAPVRLESEVPKVAGIARKERWLHEVYDFRQLVIWVAGDVANRWQYLEENSKTLAALATSQKAQCQVPGVKVYAETSIASGRR